MEDPVLKDILGYLGTQRARLETAVEAAPSVCRERRPETGGWSVAEILEHLGIVEARVTGLVTSAAAGLERNDSPPSPTDSSELDYHVLLDRTRKIQTTDASRPQGEMSAAEALVLLRRRREELLGIVPTLAGLPLHSVPIPHPALGPMNLYQWLRFIGAHEARHTEQVREVVALFGQG